MWADWHDQDRVLRNTYRQAARWTNMQAGRQAGKQAGSTTMQAERTLVNEGTYTIKIGLANGTHRDKRG